jgi:4-amino-4-deoxy-L-arabinose transferase-like glycosyltransferase
MTESSRHQLFLVVIAAVVFLGNLGGPRLFDEDEPKNAACGQEMYQRGEWIVPSFNAELRTDKPILLYWCMLASYYLFGISEFSARLPSALFAIGTILLVYQMGRRLFCNAIGCLAGVILCTSVMFDVVARAATPDSTFIFFTTLTLFVFIAATARVSHGDWGTTCTSADERTRRQRIAALVAWPYRYWLAFYAAMGMATLAKGPAGIVLPGGVVGLYLLVASCPQRPMVQTERDVTWIGRMRRAVSQTVELLSPRAILAAVWQMRPLTAVAVVAAIALPWYVAVGMRTSGDWLIGFFGHHNVGRFAQPLEGHSGPPFYYLIAIMIGFFPWSIFLSTMILDAAKRLRDDRYRQATLLVCCWVVGYVGFFTLAQTKLPNYVLPAYPALALLAAAFLHHWTCDPASTSRPLMRIVLGSLPVVGLGLAIAFPVVAYYLLPGEYVLAMIGLVLLVGGSGACWLAETDRTEVAVRCLAVTAVVFTVALFGFGSARVGRHMTSQPFAETVHSIGGDESLLATFGFLEPSLVFYHARPVIRCHTSRQIDALLADPTRAFPQAFVVAPDDLLDEIAAVARGDLVEIRRQKRFLRRGELVLLGPAAVAGANIAGANVAGANVRATIHDKTYLAVIDPLVY